MIKRIRMFLNEQLANAEKTLRSYPLSVGVAFGISALAIVSERLTGDLINMVSHRVMLVLIVVLPLAVITEYQARERKGSLSQKIGSLVAISIIALADYLWLTAHQDQMLGIHVIRQTMITLMAWLSVLTVPLIGVSFKNEITWNWINDFIHKVLITFIYMFTLFGGISIILATIDTLFNVDVPDEWYFYVWVTVTSFIGTLFMLGQWPKALAKYDDDPELEHYESGFFRSIFLTLILVYTVILYVYGAKILFTGEWPEGQVAYWVSFYASVGIIMYFYSHALLQKRHAIVRWFHKWFFALLIPLIGLLCMAIKLRIDEYGLTINRIFVMVIAAWLLINALYFMISKQKRLLWIPGTFLIAVALAGFAPINAFNASLNDQLSRMDAILENNQWLNEKGQINVKSEIANASDDAYQVSSIMRYVIENYGAAPLQPYFKEDLVEIAQYQSVWSLVDTVLKFAELPNSNGYQNLSRHFYSDQAMKNGLVVSEFDYFLPNFNPINLHITQDNTKAFTIDEDEYQIRWNEANKNVELIQNGERLVGVSLVPTIDQLLIRPIAEDYMPMDLAIISNTENNYQIQLNLTNLEINTTTSELQYLGADVWIGLP